MKRRAVLIVALVATVSSCFTGERPSFSTTPFPAGATTGDAAIDAVLSLLDTGNVGPYTADYTVLTKFGNTTHAARVAVAPDRRSVTVDAVRYISAGAVNKTCTLDGTGTCTTTIDPARISDTQITPDFYSTAAATKLRRAAVSRLGPAVAHTEAVAGGQATCVDIPGPDQALVIYCALANGILSRVDDGAVTITLTQLATTVDDSSFAAA